ncbi:MAG: flagellar basal-body MS-ring/collar protein FliF [Wolinella sp.]
MDFRTLFNQIQNLYTRLNIKQKLVILGAVVGVVAFIAFLILYNGGKGKSLDGYAVLFEGVSSQDGALIVQHLTQAQIPYKLPKEDTILIPEDKVYEERLKLASSGIPKSSKVGFEIFDKQEFGATDFDQRVKFIRATEGELGRTIESLTPIEKASVHIAIPKDSVFVSKETPPTASVVLRMRPSMSLTPAQVLGIKNLVSAAITRLEAENVRIVNENGEPLGEGDELTTSKEMATIQARYRQSFERSLEEKIINILAPVIGGADRVVAKVTAEFDFSQKESTQELFDPNNVVRSEQTLEEKREGFKPKEIGGVPGAVSNIGPVQGLDDAETRDKHEKSQTTTNFEVSKTVSSIKGEFATIKRLSAAVVVDGKYRTTTNEQGGEILEYIALSDEEMEKINGLVRQAMGFNSSRGDEVTVSNFEFDAKSAGYIPKSTAEQFIQGLEKFAGPFMPMLKYLIVGLILFIFYKKIIAPFAERMLEVHEDEDEEIESLIKLEDDDEDALTKFNEMKRRVEDQLGLGGGVSEDEIKYDVLLDKMREIATEKPEEIAAIFQTLIRDELGLDDVAAKLLADAKAKK